MVGRKLPRFDCSCSLSTQLAPKEISVSLAPLAMAADDSRVYPVGMMGFMVWDVNSTNIGALAFTLLLIAHSLSLEVVITANHAACIWPCQEHQGDGMNMGVCHRL